MKPRVLVVDDEARMASVVAAALERAGYECEACASGEAALAALDARGADAVVTDWKMPDMDGLELLRRLHALRPALPVILLTAHGDVPSAVAAMREGAFDYVTKPFDNDELRACVGRALELDRLERENRWLRAEVASRYAPESVVAESARSRELLALVRRVAPATRDGADPGRERHGEGAGGAPPPLLVGPRRKAVRRRQLQGVRRGRPRERALRPREGRVHRRRRGARRLLRARARAARSSSTRSAR